MGQNLNRVVTMAFISAAMAGVVGCDVSRDIVVLFAHRRSLHRNLHQHTCPVATDCSSQTYLGVRGSIRCRQTAAGEPTLLMHAQCRRLLLPVVAAVHPPVRETVDY